MTANTRFIAVVGAIIAVLIGILAYQKVSQCSESGGKACCFGRQCNLVDNPPAKEGVESQP